MKKFILPAIVAVAAVSGIFGYFNQPAKHKANALILANVEALTDVQEIGGTLYIVDEIPCASSANESRIDCSYVNCTDCESQHGKSYGDNGTCTSIRPLKK